MLKAREGVCPDGKEWEKEGVSVVSSVPRSPCPESQVYPRIFIDSQGLWTFDSQETKFTGNLV